MAESTDAFVEQWKPLVLHIINTYFSIIVRDVDGKTYKKIRRAVDFDDLVNEGVIALLLAKEKFNGSHDSGAQFKTYAFRAVYNTILAYVERNCTPLKVSRWRAVQSSQNGELHDQFWAATNYLCFSEFVSTEIIQSKEDAMRFATCAARCKENEPAERMEEEDFQKHVFSKLREILDEEEYRVLLLRAHGYSFMKIGKKISLSHEKVRSILKRIETKVNAAFHNEMQDCGVRNDNWTRLLRSNRKAGL